MSKQQGADMSEQPTPTAEQDAAWLNENAGYCFDGSKREAMHAIADRIKERAEHHRGTLEYIEYYRDRMQHWMERADKPHNIELGPATMDKVSKELRLGFATVAAACNEATEISWLPDELIKNARKLAAAMGEKTVGEEVTEGLTEFYDDLTQERDAALQGHTPKTIDVDAVAEECIGQLFCGPKWGEFTPEQTARTISRVLRKAVGDE